MRLIIILFYLAFVTYDIDSSRSKHKYKPKRRLGSLFDEDDDLLSSYVIEYVDSNNKHKRCTVTNPKFLNTKFETIRTLIENPTYKIVGVYSNNFIRINIEEALDVYKEIPTKFTKENFDIYCKVDYIYYVYISVLIFIAASILLFCITSLIYYLACIKN